MLAHEDFHFHYNFKKRAMPRIGDNPMIYDHIRDPHYDHNARILMDVASYLDANEAQLACDFDGVVGFTEQHQMTTFGTVVQDLKGNSLSPQELQKLSFNELAKRMLGKSEAEIMGILKKEYGLTLSVPELVELRGETYYKSVINSNLQANPFIVELWQHINDGYGQDGKMPIIVSNGRHKIQTGLLKHFGVNGQVHKVNTSDTMMTHLALTQRKPAYFEHVVAKNDKTVVIEDSASMAKHVEKDLRAKVVFVRHALNRNVPYKPKSGWELWCSSLTH